MTSKHARQTYWILNILYAIQLTSDQKSCCEVEDNTIDYVIEGLSFEALAK